MNIQTAFPSDYLKSADLGNRRIAVTIDNVVIEKIGSDDNKPVVYFEGKEKGLVLNKTNANMISEIAGSEETEQWKGAKIVIYVTNVDYQGKRVPAIRVDYPADRQPPTVVIDNSGSDDIPF